MPMAINKASFLHLLTTVLCLISFLLLFSTCTSSSHSYSHSLSSSNRKLLPTKFDFTPFLHHHHHHPKPSGNEIDPRYGLQKRLVPTGPNPLHH
ncbi:hypothetical protein V6N13_021716 [Hibiscus sabdariffa]|uniref:CLAVATA3/ESR (CLE)-related protein 13 n=1 Tax=Hibiscus sabdariffa TaxID=183260 RepID=A0ABR2BA19_9ROSI